MTSDRIQSGTLAIKLSPTPLADEDQFKSNGFVPSDASRQLITQDTRGKAHQGGRSGNRSGNDEQLSLGCSATAKLR